MIIFGEGGIELIFIGFEEIDKDSIFGVDEHLENVIFIFVDPSIVINFDFKEFFTFIGEDDVHIFWVIIIDVYFFNDIWDRFL